MYPVLLFSSGQDRGGFGGSAKGVKQDTARVSSPSEACTPQAITSADVDGMVTPAGNQPAGVPAGDVTRPDQVRSWYISSSKAVDQVPARVSRWSESCAASGVMTASKSSVYLLEFCVLYPVLSFSSAQDRGGFGGLVVAQYSKLYVLV